MSGKNSRLSTEMSIKCSLSVAGVVDQGLVEMPIIGINQHSAADALNMSDLLSYPKGNNYKIIYRIRQTRGNPMFT